VAGMNAGKDVRTLMREITMPPEYEVGQGYGKVAWDVRAIWENYSGWFHHRSTTELYPVAFDEVAADVVELAGADPLVQRAREHLSAGRPLHAIPGRGRRGGSYVGRESGVNGGAPSRRRSFGPPARGSAMGRNAPVATTAQYA